MKYFNYSLLSFLLVIFFSCKPSEDLSFKVSNPFNEPVSGKAIVLSRDIVEEYIKEESSSLYDVLVTDMNGEVLVSQTDDLDGDGNWDELVFIADFDQNETKQFYFKAIDPDELPEFTKMTAIRFSRVNPPYESANNDLRLKSTDSPTISAVFQMEGPAWENDIVGFRNYYDARNGIDIFGKRTSEMALHKAGIEGQDYHSLDDWGMDILKVANSLGAGAIAISFDNEVYRVGPAETAGFRLITEGAVRSIFDLTFEGVPAGDRSYDVVHRISIYAGEHFYRSAVLLSPLQGDEVLYTGIVDLDDLELYESRTADYMLFGTHGNQAIEGEVLGLGLIIPLDTYLHQNPAPESGDGVVQTYLTALKLEEGLPSEYAFFAGWEYQDEGFKSFEYFKEMLAKAVYKFDDKAWTK